MTAPVFVIAEAAGTHDGGLEKACDLVDLAADVGVDACKFQWLSSPERLAERRHAPEYLDAYRLLEFPRAWFPLLTARCASRGIAFMCTAYIPEDVSVVAEYVARFKVASFEAGDAAFVALHGLYPSIPLVISAGMATDLTASLRAYRACRSAVVRAEGPPPLSVAAGPWVLACTSAYPCPVEDASLRRILDALSWNSEERAYRIRGYSDHTRHPWTGALAVAAGAEIVEFHYRLDDTSPANADYAVARTPQEAAEYVRNLRLTERMLGDGSSGSRPVEAKMLRYRVSA